jgi:hypothetical protein
MRIAWVRRRRGDLFRYKLVRPDRPLTKRDRRVFALQRERLKQRRAARARRKAAALATTTTHQPQH